MARQDAFKARHPEWQHRDVPFGETATRRLVASWRALLDSQNGRDVDDILPGGMTAFLESVELRPTADFRRLLVLGCGTGEEVLEAREAGWQAEGMTLGPMNVAEATEMGLDIRFEDFHTNTIPTGSFDVVVGRQTWEHSFAPLLFAVECARILRPGGRLALETPCAKEFIYDSPTIHHAFCPTPFQGQRMLEKAGFVLVNALDGSHGTPVLFGNSKYHRDDVGGGNIVFIGERWIPGRDDDRLSETVRRMTQVHIDADVSTPASVDGSASTSANRLIEAPPATREEQISALYHELLGREPDTDGLTHYIHSGLLLDDIRQEIANSPEGRARRGA